MKYLFKNEDNKINSCDEYYIKYNKVHKNEQKIVILELLNKFGYTLYELQYGLLKIIVCYPDYPKKKIDSIKSFMGSINSIFGNHGIRVTCEQKSIKYDGKKQMIYFIVLLWMLFIKCLSNIIGTYKSRIYTIIIILLKTDEYINNKIVELKQNSFTIEYMTNIYNKIYL